MKTDLPGLIDCIAPQLAVVEKQFLAELKSDINCVNTLVKHVSRFRGKMLRPTLVLACGLASAGSGSDPVSPAHITLAAVCEMMCRSTE